MVQAARSLAALVDANPTTSPLWGRYLAALGALREQPNKHQDDALVELLAELQGPMGDQQAWVNRMDDERQG